jgi:hypothetical protein
MDDNGEGLRWLNTRNIGIAVIFLVIVLAIIVLGFTLNRRQSPSLMPALPTPTVYSSASVPEPTTVTFTELNENPIAYLNQPIIVSGEFLPLQQAECRRLSGPNVQWSLTAENLQLDVLGFERIVRLLPDATPMTVQGIWKLYQGPLGCGKAPARDSIWYLESKKIIQPNPLVSAGGQTIPLEIIRNQPELPQSVQPGTENQPGTIATQTPESTSISLTVIPTTTPAEQIIPTETPSLPEQSTPLPTASIDPTLVLPTSTQVPGATPPATTAAPTATATQSSAESTPTITAEAPPIPATATETNGSGGYPGPEGTATPSPTATPNPYP